MNDVLTHLDLFSGVGGFTVAAERAGFRTVGFSEVEPYCCRVLAERWPAVPNAGDIRQPSGFARFRGCTVATGGFPCQPVSEAGEQRGEADHRWLWPAMCDVLSLVRPAWVIGENTTGLLDMGLLDQVCADLENLGYSTQSFTIPASGAGAWHVRERVWILAHLAGGRCEGRDLRTGQRRSEPADVSSDALQPGPYADALSGVYCGEEGGGTRHVDPAGPFRWPAESPLLRVVHGIPNRAHRIKALGNSIVPQVAEPFFEIIAAIERGEIA